MDDLFLNVPTLLVCLGRRPGAFVVICVRISTEFVRFEPNFSDIQPWTNYYCFSYWYCFYYYCFYYYWYYYHYFFLPVLLLQILAFLPWGLSPVTAVSHAPYTTWNGLMTNIHLVYGTKIWDFKFGSCSSKLCGEILPLALDFSRSI